MGLLGDGVLDDFVLMFIPLGVMPTAAWRHHQLPEKEMPDTAPKLFCDFLIGKKTAIHDPQYPIDQDFKSA